MTIFFGHHLERGSYIVAFYFSLCIYYFVYVLGQPNCPYSIHYFLLIKKKSHVFMWIKRNQFTCNKKIQMKLTEV